MSTHLTKLPGKFARTQAIKKQRTAITLYFLQYYVFLANKHRLNQKRRSEQIYEFVLSMYPVRFTLHSRTETPCRTNRCSSKCRIEILTSLKSSLHKQDILYWSFSYEHVDVTVVYKLLTKEVTLQKVKWKDNSTFNTINNKEVT